MNSSNLLLLQHDHILLAPSIIMLNARRTRVIRGDSNGWRLFIDSTSSAQEKEFHVDDILGKYRIT